MPWRNHMRIAKCLYLLGPFYTSSDKCFNGRMFYMRKSVYMEPCEFCYRLQCYLPFKNLPGLVTCKRGLITKETDNLGIITTQVYNSLLRLTCVAQNVFALSPFYFECITQITSLWKSLKKAIIKWHNLRRCYSAGANSIVFAVFFSLLTASVQYFPPKWNLDPTNDRCNFEPVRFVPMTLLFVPMTLSCEWVQCYEGSRGELAPLQKSPRYSLRSKRFRAVSDQKTRKANQNPLSLLRNQRKCSLRRLPQHYVMTPSKRIQDSLGFWIPCHGFRNLDFNSQWDFGFLELYSGFQSPGFQNADSLSFGECKQAKNTLTSTFKYVIFLTCLCPASAIFVTLALSSVISSTNIYRQTSKQTKKIKKY